MKTMGPVILKEIRDSAIRIAIRLAIGEYLIRGPHDNVMELESRVAWATVIAELYHEGYVLIAPDEYAAAYGLASADVIDRIEKDGSLFALIYPAKGETLTVVPMADRQEREQLGPIPG